MTLHTRLFGHGLFLSLLSLCVAITTPATAEETRSPAPQASIINFRDAANVRSHRPIIIAHRGGIVGDDAPECSLTALRRAAKFGFNMVELDVRVSGDGKPVLFHDRTLKNACGQDGSVADYKLSELEAIPYKRSRDRIASLDTALRLCRELKLGVMLDLKFGSESSDFLRQLKQLLMKHCLMHSTITFSGTKKARQTLTGIRFTPTDDELRRLRAGEQLDLNHRFWFGLPKQLTANDIERLQSAKALVLPAINTFRYAGQDHMVFAQKDVLRLTRQGVDGFQIDSVYFEMVKNTVKSERRISFESIHLPQKRISD